MPTLGFTGTPQKDDAASKKVYQPPPAVTAASPPQQQQRTHHLAMEKVHDCEPATSTTGDINNKSTMIESLLLRSKELSFKPAATSFPLTWNEVGIFQQQEERVVVDNTNSDDGQGKKKNTIADTEKIMLAGRKDFRLLSQWDGNSIPNQQYYQQQQQEQQNEEKNDADEVIIIDDSSSEEEQVKTTKCSATAAPIVHVSPSKRVGGIAEDGIVTTTTTTQVQQEPKKRRDDDVPNDNNAGVRLGYPGMVYNKTLGIWVSETTEEPKQLTTTVARDQPKSQWVPVGTAKETGKEQQQLQPQQQQFQQQQPIQYRVSNPVLEAARQQLLTQQLPQHPLFSHQLQLQQQQQQQLQQQKQLRQKQLQHQVAPRHASNGHNQQKGGAQSNTSKAPPAPPKPTNTANETSHNERLPNLERFSEYRIDDANSITELEAIRHRLLILVERTNTRLKDMRVRQALGREIGVKGVEKLSIKELVKMLSEQVEEPTDNVDEPSSADEGPAMTTNGKRNHSETEEKSSRPGKKQRCCPLCFSTSHLQSGTNRSSAARGVATRSITCSVCEDDGICFKCHSRCLKCLNLICADCFVCCSKCNSSAYCSECVESGNGKCASCLAAEQQAQKRAEKRAEKKTNEPLPTVVKPSNRGIPTQITVRASEKKINESLPLPTAKPLPPKTIFGATDSKPSESKIVHRFYITGDTRKIGCTLKGPGGPGGARITIVGIEANSVAAQLGIQEDDELFVPGMPVEKMRNDFLAALTKPRPTVFHVLRSYPKQANDALQLQMPLHRFIINEPGVLGLTLRKMGSASYISSVVPGSVAERHGICVNDILCKPFTNGSEISGMYDWFLQRARSNTRPLIFEVLRQKSVAPKPRYSFGDENPFLYQLPDGLSAVEANK